MKRREFIKNTGKAITLPFLLNGLDLLAQPKPAFFDPSSMETDRVLVLVRLSGGNDGLNTVIPLDQYDNLYRARPTIIVPQNKILGLTDTTGFHPMLSGIKSLFDNGQLKIIQSVGYPDQNRSHFRSMEIWSTGLTDQESVPGDTKTGWLGRFLDDQFPGFPDDYPNAAQTDPFAISMGAFVSETCQGKAANFSMSLEDPFSLGPLPGEIGNPQYGAFFRDELAFVKLMMTQTTSYSSQILDAAKKGNNLVDYPDTPLAQQLKNVALLIAGGLQTKIYIVDHTGFDTHSAQVSSAGAVEGRHAKLLTPLSDAIAAFQEDLNQLKISQRVLGMTFSEFGRQIRANNSLGSDHGEAAPLFVFGDCVDPQILGHSPQIPETVQVQEAVPMQYDFRDLYSTVLLNWFGLPREMVEKVTYPGFQVLPILGSCAMVTDTGTSLETPIQTDAFPNPFRDAVVIRFHSDNERVRVSIFDLLGNEIEVLSDQRFPYGQHEIRFESRHLPAGTYFYRLSFENGRQKSKKIIKIK